MSRLNKPLTQVKVAETEGNGYAGGIEVFHQVAPPSASHLQALMRICPDTAD